MQTTAYNPNCAARGGGCATDEGDAMPAAAWAQNANPDIAALKDSMSIPGYHGIGCLRPIYDAYRADAAAFNAELHRIRAPKMDADIRMSARHIAYQQDTLLLVGRDKGLIYDTRICEFVDPGDRLHE